MRRTFWIRCGRPKNGSRWSTTLPSLHVVQLRYGYPVAVENVVVPLHGRCERIAGDPEVTPLFPGWRSLAPNPGIDGFGAGHASISRCSACAGGSVPVNTCSPGFPDLHELPGSLTPVDLGGQIHNPAKPRTVKRLRI